MHTSHITSLRVNPSIQECSAAGSRCAIRRCHCCNSDTDFVLADAAVLRAGADRRTSTVDLFFFADLEAGVAGEAAGAVAGIATGMVARVVAGVVTSVVAGVGAGVTAGVVAGMVGGITASAVASMVAGAAPPDVYAVAAVAVLRLYRSLADCCGARSVGISFCRDARCRKMLVARVCARTASFPSILPVLLSFQILLPYPPLPSGCPPLTTTSVVAAGGEPGRSWTAARRPHRGPRAGGGPCVGGRPRGWPGLSRAPARTPQSPMRRLLGLALGTGTVGG